MARYYDENGGKVCIRKRLTCIGCVGGHFKGIDDAQVVLERVNKLCGFNCTLGNALGSSLRLGEDQRGRECQVMRDALRHQYLTVLEAVDDT